MSGNPLVRFDEGRVGRTFGCRPLSYSTGSFKDSAEGKVSTPGIPRNCNVPLPPLPSSTVMVYLNFPETSGGTIHDSLQ